MHRRIVIQGGPWGLIQFTRTKGARRELCHLTVVRGAGFTPRNLPRPLFYHGPCTPPPYPQPCMHAPSPAQANVTWPTLCLRINIIGRRKRAGQRSSSPIYCLCYWAPVLFLQHGWTLPPRAVIVRQIRSVFHLLNCMETTQLLLCLRRKRNTRV